MSSTREEVARTDYERLTAYADPLVVEPGEQAAIKVNCTAESFDVEVVRVHCGDAHPRGPGLWLEPVAVRGTGTYPGRIQRIAAGSRGVIPHRDALEGVADLTVQITAYPTAAGKGPQTLMAKWSDVEQRGFRLEITDEGVLAFVLGDGTQVERVNSTTPLRSATWVRISASFDQATGRTRLSSEALLDCTLGPSRDVVDATVQVTTLESDAPITFACHYEMSDDRRMSPVQHYNGKLEKPRLARRVLTHEEVRSLAGSVTPAEHLCDDLLGAWDFSADITSDRVRDVSGNGLTGHLVNLPARAVPGTGWDGEEHRWVHAPEQWDAVHFHDDDLYDAEWETDVVLEIPGHLASGVYAVRLSIEGAGYDVPLIVRPRRHQPTADLLLVLPTATYLGYGNEHWATDKWHGDLMWEGTVELAPSHLFLHVHREYGHSLYDDHADGSGVYYASSKRPVLNMSPIADQDHLGTSLNWPLSRDTHLTAWLASRGYSYDVVTDEELHHEGEDLLRSYRVVMSGCHPEYFSKAMYDALQAYTLDGGRLMYVGGNAAYWRIAYSESFPGAVEHRRAEDGSRNTEPPSGEYYHSFTGELSGLWRRQGSRAPQVLFGVGFASESFDDSATYYVRCPDSHDPRVSFIFEGISEDERIGDFGLFGSAHGGAAGLHLDRYDRDLGTPEHALRLATSQALSPGHVVLIEEQLFDFFKGVGAETNRSRADMTFFETPNGGAVFSVGSLTWGGALSFNDYDNNVARISEAVLRRFLDPRPFDVSPTPADGAPVSRP